MIMETRQRNKTGASTAVKSETERGHRTNDHDRTKDEPISTRSLQRAGLAVRAVPHVIDLKLW